VEYIIANWEIIFIGFLLLAVFASFLFERFSPDITAMGAFLALGLTGILSPKDSLSVFSNPAPITIGAMFILSEALDRTGCVEFLGKIIKRHSGHSQLSLMLAVLPIVLIISAFMNNTPVVIILTPVLISIARHMELAPSKILIPLSYAGMMGGSMTLIGSSTNLLVSGIAVDSGLPAFNLFDITVPALIMSVVGFAYLFFIGRHLLPERHSAASMLDGQTGKKYIAQLLVPHNSKLIGKEVLNTHLVKGAESWVVDIMRHGDSMKKHLKDLTLKAGDRIVLETNAEEILGIKENVDILFENPHFDMQEVEPISATENLVVEGVVAQNSELIGKLFSALGFRRKYGVYVVGIQKTSDTRIYRHQSNTLQAGDALLLEGPAEGMKTLFEENGLINLTIPEDRPVRRKKAPIAILTLIGVVGLAAFNIMPISILALTGACIVTMTRCINAKDVYKTIDWSILFLIFGMLGLSLGMERTGAAKMIVGQVVDLTKDHGPIILLAAFYILTSVLTEIISNNAVAALLAPIAIGVATTLGFDPKPFLVAVMFGGSASFATPIGYQTNTFVFGAGGYKFGDFVKIGLPLNIIMFITAIIVIPMFWEI